MRDNFFSSMLSEGGKISHKRFISLIASIIMCLGSAFAIVKYKEFTTDIIHSLMLFILVMSGVATIGQIVSIVRGGNNNNEKQKENENTKN